MAHSYSQTLLARCGFNDVDRGNARHTLACLYVGHHMRLTALDEAKADGRYPRDIEAQYEVPVKTRSGFVIGFVDVAHRVDYYNWRAAEIKITPQTADDILRQVQLYKGAYQETSPQEFWIVCDFDTTMLQTLAAGNPDIKVLRLGPAFDEWCAEQADAAPATANLL